MEVENTYHENRKKKEIKEEARRWTNLLCSLIGRIDSVKMNATPVSTTTYLLNTITIKISIQFFTKIGNELSHIT